MAQGDLTLFTSFAKQLGEGIHTFDSHTIKVALISDTPSASTTTPLLADYTEVSGSGYVAGGRSIENDTWTIDTGKYKYDGDNVTWDQDSAGPTDIHWAIIYNDTATDNPCIGFVEMGNPGGTTAVSLQNGNITITWDANGIFTVDA